MDNLMYLKPNRWKVKRIGIRNSFVSIGMDKKTYKDYIVMFVNNLYNKIIRENLDVIYHYEYSKDEYERSYLIFTDSSNKITKIEIKQVI